MAGFPRGVTEEGRVQVVGWFSPWCYRRRAGAGSGLVFPMADLAPAPTSLFPAPVLVGRAIALSPNFDLE
ncbi:hypothetical protein NIES39_L01730 [Arthrospira platensis NIES-39]|nr:hypothetical protein NIES39_L01730 [Arthrospira platensis NIES-39]